MRYEGTRPSGADPEVDVHKFSMGIEEVKLLSDILRQFKHSLPKVLELTQTRDRVRNMIKILSEPLTGVRWSKHAPIRKK